MQFRLIIVYWGAYTRQMITESKYMILSFKSKRFALASNATLQRWSFVTSVVLILSWNAVVAQINTFPSKITDPGHTFVPVPVVYFTPETNWAFGARASYTFHLDSLHHRPSTIQVRGLYTLRQQLITNMAFSLYRPEKRWELVGELGYQDYVYKYWGIGNSKAGGSEETYEVRYPSLKLSPTYVLSRFWRVGLTGDFQHYSRPHVDEDGELFRQQTTGIAGGFVNGIGLQLQYDGRDHTIFPIRGLFASAKSILYNPLWGSDYSFVATELDFRSYRNIAGGIIWANQLVAAFRSGPEIPFYHLAMLGGVSIMRGYFEGRYRNQNLWAIQSEFRIPVWRKFFMVPFASAGDVFDFEDYHRSIKFAGGMGLRYIVNHENRVTVRADLAYGHNFQFYLSILEAF